jgi:alkaline phosphatase D
VLWTRLAPDPADPDAMGPGPVRVGWRVATDERMRRVVSRGLAIASPELAHSVHAEVDGLRAGRDYYQFDAHHEESPVGHFRTAPPEHVLADKIRFAFVTCQDWPSGHYIAYRDLLHNDLDLVCHLGDYTYEYAIDSTRRGIPAPAGFEEECRDLRTYRLRHTLLGRPQGGERLFRRRARYASPSPEFLARRAAAYQAYYEHMPIRAAAARHPDRHLRIFRHLPYGRLAEFTLLDGRQYRTDNPCGDGEALRCPAAEAGDYTMLGQEQERWLGRGFALDGPLEHRGAAAPDRGARAPALRG